MGWTSYRATHYKNGKVDRKAEMDARFTQHEHDVNNFNGGTYHYPKMEVVKSSMVGSTYYAAVRTTNSQTGYDHTWAAVCLTSTKWSDGMNFGYKDMDETVHPFYYDCPKRILDLLSPTDNENALEWRRKCEEKRRNKKEKPSLSKLPIGTRIKFKNHNGKEIKAYKHDAGYQFKRPFWMLTDGTGYFPQKYIPENYEIIPTYYTDRIYGGRFTYEEMVEDAKKNYDYGDETNILTYTKDWWKEYYKVVND